MLLFVRAPYSNALRDGRKTIEVRWGPRYRHIRPGDVVSINGRFRMEVTKRETFASSEDPELTRAVLANYRAIGLEVPDGLVAGITHMGYSGGPIFFFHLKMVSGGAAPSAPRVRKARSAP
jgi:hypothetical protein